VVIHIFYLIGFGNRVLVLLQWAYAYVTFRQRVRLITGEDPSSPLVLAEPTRDAQKAI
jgi:NADH:ubiquinone reductase (H+-translocating)